MTFVIGEECVDVLDKTCMDICPVDSIYTGLRKNYINPVECINCSACRDVCPVQAIYLDSEAGTDPARLAHIEDGRRFFDDPLDGRAAPLGNPGGAAMSGDIGVDTELVSRLSIRT